MEVRALVCNKPSQLKEKPLQINAALQSQITLFNTDEVVGNNDNFEKSNEESSDDFTHQHSNIIRARFIASSPGQKRHQGQESQNKMFTNNITNHIILDEGKEKKKKTHHERKSFSYNRQTKRQIKTQQRKLQQTMIIQKAHCEMRNLSIDSLAKNSFYRKQQLIDTDYENRNPSKFDIISNHNSNEPLSAGASKNHQQQHHQSLQKKIELNLSNVVKSQNDNFRASESQPSVKNHMDSDPHSAHSIQDNQPHNLLPKGLSIMKEIKEQYQQQTSQFISNHTQSQMIIMTALSKPESIYKKSTSDIAPDGAIVKNRTYSNLNQYENINDVEQTPPKIVSNSNMRIQDSGGRKSVISNKFGIISQEKQHPQYQNKINIFDSILKESSTSNIFEIKGESLQPYLNIHIDSQQQIQLQNVSGVSQPQIQQSQDSSKETQQKLLGIPQVANAYNNHSNQSMDSRGEIQGVSIAHTPPDWNAVYHQDSSQLSIDQMTGLQGPKFQLQDQKQQRKLLLEKNKKPLSQVLANKMIEFPNDNQNLIMNGQMMIEHDNYSSNRNQSFKRKRLLQDSNDTPYREQIYSVNNHEEQVITSSKNNKKKSLSSDKQSIKSSNISSNQNQHDMKNTCVGTDELENLMFEDIERQGDQDSSSSGGGNTNKSANEIQNVNRMMSILESKSKDLNDDPETKAIGLGRSQYKKIYQQQLKANTRVIFKTANGLSRVVQFDRNGASVDLDLMVKAQAIGLKITGDHITPLKENAMFDGVMNGFTGNHNIVGKNNSNVQASSFYNESQTFDLGSKKDVFDVASSYNRPFQLPLQSQYNHQNTGTNKGPFIAYIDNPIMIRESESFHNPDSIIDGIGIDSILNSKVQSPQKVHSRINDSYLQSAANPSVAKETSATKMFTYQVIQNFDDKEGSKNPQSQYQLSALSINPDEKENQPHQTKQEEQITAPSHAIIELKSQTLSSRRNQSSGGNRINQDLFHQQNEYYEDSRNHQRELFQNSHIKTAPPIHLSNKFQLIKEESSEHTLIRNSNNVTHQQSNRDNLKSQVLIKDCNSQREKGQPGNLFQQIANQMQDAMRFHALRNKSQTENSGGSLGISYTNLKQFSPMFKNRDQTEQLRKNVSIINNKQLFQQNTYKNLSYEVFRQTQTQIELNGTADNKKFTNTFTQFKNDINDGNRTNLMISKRERILKNLDKQIIDSQGYPFIIPSQTVVSRPAQDSNGKLKSEFQYHNNYVVSGTTLLNDSFHSRNARNQLVLREGNLTTFSNNMNLTNYSYNRSTKRRTYTNSERKEFPEINTNKIGVFNNSFLRSMNNTTTTIQNEQKRSRNVSNRKNKEENRQKLIIFNNNTTGHLKPVNHLYQENENDHIRPSNLVNIDSRSQIKNTKAIIMQMQLKLKVQRLQEV